MIKPPLNIPHLPKIKDPLTLKDLAINPRVQKYTKKYKLSKEQDSQKMANEIADKKNAKRREFLLDLIKAIIVALTTLFIEHIADIVKFIHGILQSYF